MNFTSAGFELYIPPSPMINHLLKPPHRARFVLVDDINDKFYDVDYDGANDPSKLGNTLSWAKLALHKVTDPAIVLPGDQWKWLHHEERNFS